MFSTNRQWHTITIFRTNIFFTTFILRASITISSATITTFYSIKNFTTRSITAYCPRTYHLISREKSLRTFSHFKKTLRIASISINIISIITLFRATNNSIPTISYLNFTTITIYASTIRSNFSLTKTSTKIHTTSCRTFKNFLLTISTTSIPIKIISFITARSNILNSITTKRNWEAIIH